MKSREGAAPALRDLPPAPSTGEATSNPAIDGDVWATALACKNDPDEALRLAGIVRAHEIGGQRLRPQVVRHGKVHCVLIGPFYSEREAKDRGEQARPILDQGVKPYYMPQWCTYLGPQYGGIRQCTR